MRSWADPERLQRNSRKVRFPDPRRPAPGWCPIEKAFPRVHAFIPASIDFSQDSHGGDSGGNAAGGCRPSTPERPKIAALVTEYRRRAHGQHIVDRFLGGYGWAGRFHRPPMDVVSLYVDQVRESDLSRDRAREYPSMKIFPTIAEALTRGGDRLAVDGVLLIGEHGSYPRNEKGQTLYPRYEFFRQIVEVFRASGRGVPVFNDKHLSWKWEWAQEMVETARELDFALMAGSSIPVAWRLPPLEIPSDAEVEEAMVIGAGGGADSYGFHGFEAIQCMVERRRGGETGVAALQAVRGPRVWEALRAGSWDRGGWDSELFEACLCRSLALTSTREGFDHSYPSLGGNTRAGQGPGHRLRPSTGPAAGLSLRIRRRDEGHAASVGRPHHGLDLCGPFEKPATTGFNTLLPSGARVGRRRRSQLLQPAGERRREDVSDRQGNLPGGADPADQRNDRGRRGFPVARAAPR